MKKQERIINTSAFITFSSAQWRVLICLQRLTTLCFLFLSMYHSSFSYIQSCDVISLALTQKAKTHWTVIKRECIYLQKKKKQIFLIFKVNRLIIHIQIKRMRAKDNMYIHNKKKTRVNISNDVCLFSNNNVEFIDATGRH